MSQPRRSEPVLRFRPTAATLIRRIRSLAQDSRNVGFGRHALERLELRGISDLEALRVLRTGEIKGEIEPGQTRGEWKCKIVAPIKGSREVGVVTIAMLNGHLFVKTVEWED